MNNNNSNQSISQKDDLPHARELYETLESYRTTILLQRGYHPIIDDIDLLLRNRQILKAKYYQMEEDMDKREEKFRQVKAIRQEIEGFRRLLKPSRGRQVEKNSSK